MKAFAGTISSSGLLGLVKPTFPVRVTVLGGTLNCPTISTVARVPTLDETLTPTPDLSITCPVALVTVLSLITP
jgi:hypothetical protein